MSKNTQFFKNPISRQQAIELIQSFSSSIKFEEVSITSSAPLVPQSVQLSTPSPVVIGRTIVGANGPWASIAMAGQTGDIVFENLIGLVFLTGLGNCTLSFPVAEVIQALPSGAGSSITAISIPEVVAGDLSLLNHSLLTSLSAPKAITISNLILLGNSLLDTVSLPEVVNITGSLQSTSGNAALVNFTLGENLRWVNSSVNFSSCALNQASVDNILIRLAALDGTAGKQLYGAGKTVTITGTSATPSSAGNTAKLALQARGVIVNTN